MPIDPDPLTFRGLPASPLRHELSPERENEREMKKNILTLDASRAVMMALAVAFTSIASIHAAETDPAGVLRKPIPDKLVVLTFDDGPASGFTVVAPILKSHGFNGSFYVCDFDSFRTRKDWYMTFRQMKELDRQGFEIGNHSEGHTSGFDAMMKMEDQLLANGIPKPTTIAWPLYHANVTPDFQKAGYIFARGGHSRPYRPTVDNPLDIPSMESKDLTGFVKMVRQAAGGKIVTICYHGVPDMEHPGVSLEPEMFKMQMQYLKDNHYKVIAMRELSEYIDPEKAATLSKTDASFKDPGPVVLASEEKPCGVLPVNSAVGNVSRPPVQKHMQKLPAPAGLVTPTDSSKPNVFTWHRAEPGNWSDASKWSNNMTSGSAPAAGGQADYVFTFNQRGSGEVKIDLKAGFLLNRLNLEDSSGGTTLSGNSITFTKDEANGVAPVISAGKCGRVDIKVPVNLRNDLSVNTVSEGDPNCFISFHEVISGTGAMILNSYGEYDVQAINFHDVHFGILQINNSNTYSGGTMINGGKINVSKADGLGTGPVSLDNFGTLACAVSIANPLTVNDGILFHCSTSGPVQLNGDARFIGNCSFSGNMSGPGGFTMLGNNGTYLNIVPGGAVTLNGENTYTGPTTIFAGSLIVKKAGGLYNGDAAKWTPSNITLHKAATLRLSVGGSDEFSGVQVGQLLGKLTTSIAGNGLMGGSVLCLDVTTGTVAVATDISDSKGSGGGAFLLKKCGAGMMRLSGKNTYTGQTILEGGVLTVSSLNSVVNGMPSSSLGAPKDIEAGEIVLGELSKDGDCTLVYTGTGETTDRVMNLAGKNSMVTFDHSGKGLLKFATPFVISGYGANKTIVLKGDTAGRGEFAGSIFNPHDRTGKATTSVTKSGTGTWVLSGNNTFTGATTVKQGTLSIASGKSLGVKVDVYISEGAVLDLGFNGEIKINKLYIDEKQQPAGTYSAGTMPKHIKGKGSLKSQ